jgi:hypothetical protein
MSRRGWRTDTGVTSAFWATEVKAAVRLLANLGRLGCGYGMVALAYSGHSNRPTTKLCHPPTMCYTTHMATKILTDAMKLVETWPEAAQAELAMIAFEMDTTLNGGVYHATQDELAGIDRGLLAADQRRFVEPGDVAAVFAKHRPA